MVQGCGTLRLNGFHPDGVTMEVAWAPAGFGGGSRNSARTGESLLEAPFLFGTGSNKGTHHFRDRLRLKPFCKGVCQLEDPQNGGLSVWFFRLPFEPIATRVP